MDQRIKPMNEKSSSTGWRIAGADHRRAGADRDRRQSQGRIPLYQDQPACEAGGTGNGSGMVAELRLRPRRHAAGRRARRSRSRSGCAAACRASGFARPCGASRASSASTAKSLNDGEGVLIRARGAEARVAALVDRLETRAAALGADRAHRDRRFRRRLARRLPYRCQRAGCDAHPDVARRGDLPGLRRRSARSRRTALSLSLYQLHPLRAAADDRRAASLTTASQTTMAPLPAVRRPASPNTAIPPTAAFMRRPSPARHCGPRAVLRRIDAGVACEIPGEISASDAAEAAARLIRAGEIVAIKGLGGYHLACDATNADAVARLRRLKHRDAKPFALMARDLAMVRRYCTIAPEEERALTGAPAPIVVLRADGPERLPDAVAPGLSTLGFMLPTTPLHLLVMAGLEAPGGDDQRQSFRRAAGHRRRRGAGPPRRHRRLRADARPRDRQPGRRFGGARDGREGAPAAPRARLCAGADRAAAGLRNRAGHPGDGRRAEGDLLPRQGRPGDPVAASGRSRAPGGVRRLPQEPGALPRAVRSRARRRWRSICIPNTCRRSSRAKWRSAAACR